MAPVSPRCWKCGYELTGLKVEHRCPECATPIWTTPPGETIANEALRSIYFGLASVVSFFLWMGPTAPLALALGIPAIVYARRALRMVRTGRADGISAQPAVIGRFLGVMGVTLGGIASVVLLISIVF